MRSSKVWIQTASGRAVDLLNPDPQAFLWSDVADSLAKICRFNGHSCAFYSVAQHSCFVHDLLPPEEPRLRLQGLLHDAHEAFIGDLTSPMKAALTQVYGESERFEVFERGHMRAVALKAGLPWPWPPEWEIQIKRADLKMLATEKRDLHEPEPRPWHGGLPDPAPFKIKPQAWPDAAEAFLDRLAIGLGVDLRQPRAPGQILAQEPAA